MEVASGEERELAVSSSEQRKISLSTIYAGGQGETCFNTVEDSPKKYYPQIDYIKGLAILSVLLLHTIPSMYLIESYSTLYIWQAVPIFMIMMGITYHLSFVRMRQNAGIKNPYTKEYFRSKLSRFMLPFILVCIIDLVIAVLLGRLDGHAIISIPLSFIVVLPVPSPGGYFITILFQFILFAPLLSMISRRPIAALILLFVTNLAFELAGP